MSEKKLSNAALAREHAMAEVLKTFVPQLFTSPKVLSENAPDVGDIDLWMLTNMPADILIPLVGLQIIAEEDNRPEIKKFNEYILRGLKGIGGFAARQGENIALGLGGGLGRKVVRKPGWLARNITNRNWRKKAEEEGAEVEE